MDIVRLRSLSSPKGRAVTIVIRIQITCETSAAKPCVFAPHYQGSACGGGSIEVKSLRKHAFGSPRKGGGQEDQLADPEHQGELLQLLKVRRPLILRPSPAPQLIAANSSTHSKGRLAASGPGVVVSGQACRDSFGKHTAILPIMLSDNATPGAPYAAAVRPQPCLASWEPVFAGVTCCGAPVMDASMRVSPGNAVCGAQKERGTLLRCAVGTLSRRPASRT